MDTTQPALSLMSAMAYPVEGPGLREG
jgi:hypothetical protein